MRVKVRIEYFLDDTYLIPSGSKQLRFNELSRMYEEYERINPEKAEEIAEKLYDEFEKYIIEDLNSIQLYAETKDL